LDTIYQIKLKRATILFFTPFQETEHSLHVLHYRPDWPHRLRTWSTKAPPIIRNPTAGIHFDDVATLRPGRLLLFGLKDSGAGVSRTKALNQQVSRKE
jgi:hypothetical protein